MEVRNVINIIIIYLLGSFFVSAQQIQNGDGIFIKANISELINLNQEYCHKKNKKNKIIFSFGMETLGEINNFIFNKGLNNHKFISSKDYESIEFSSIKGLNKILHDKKEFENPNSIFKNIYVVEKNRGEIIVYPVKWKKIIFEE